LRDLIAVHDTGCCFDLDLKMDRRMPIDRLLKLSKQRIDKRNVSDTTNLWHDNDVKHRTSCLNNVDEITVAPRRINAIDPDHPWSATPISLEQSRYDVPSRFCFGLGHDGIFKVEKNDVGVAAKGLLDHIWP
jgi:hypothetical protein